MTDASIGFGMAPGTKGGPWARRLARRRRERLRYPHKLRVGDLLTVCGGCLLLWT